MGNDTRCLLIQAKRFPFSVRVCAYRGAPRSTQILPATLRSSASPAPCGGRAQHWTQEQVFERLCNPRSTSDAEYGRMIEFVVSAHRGAA